MLHSLTAIAAVPASGPGALAGFESRCSCGLVIRSSLRTIVEADVREHVAYFAKREAARKAPARRRRYLPTESCAGCATCDPAIAAREAALDEQFFADLSAEF